MVVLIALSISLIIYFFFFNDAATTEIYTLSLHDALPISIPRVAPALLQSAGRTLRAPAWRAGPAWSTHAGARSVDRKSTRLNSSHSQISYAVFCLKKKKTRSYHRKWRCFQSR